MSVPAFLLHTTTPRYSLPTNHFALAISPPRHHGTAPSASRRARATTTAVVVGHLGLTADDGHGSSRDDASTRRSEEASLEETFDAIDDVVMDRQPGEGRDKVKVFGAWLDADVAGRKAGQGNRAAGLIARAERGEALTDQEKAEVFYEEAIHEMKKGKYDASYALLEKAVSLTGESSRRGGEFKLWAAQALQGVGRNKQAVDLLKGMKTHSDRDVRKVSAELLYIAQAPQLKLTKDDFVRFPDVSHLNDSFDKTKWKELSKPKVAPYKKKPKGDKGYYVGKDTGQAPGNDPVMLVTAVGAILALSYAFLL